MKVGPRQGLAGQESLFVRPGLLLRALIFSIAELVSLKEKLNRLGSFWIDLWVRMEGSNWKYI